MNAARWLAVVAIATGIAACGGGHRKMRAERPARVPSDAAPSSASAPILPASGAGPTTCTVYESGYATQVIFDSASLNVTGECQAWISREPGAGYLWAYQPTTAAIDETAVRACGLRDPSGRVTVTVVADTGFAPVSALERENVATACSSLTAAGWIRPPRG